MTTRSLVLPVVALVLWAIAPATAWAQEDVPEVENDGVPVYCTIIQAPPRAPIGTETRIDSTELERRGARSLPDALATEPSVDVQRSPKDGASMQLRGFDERSMQVLFEGIPIREVYDGHFDLGALSVFGLGSVRLERGVTSLLYGPNSAGGVIALEAPRECGHAVNLATYADVPREGIWPFAGAGGRTCVGFSKFTIFASGGYEHSQGYVLPNDYAPTSQNAQFHEAGGVRDGSDYSRSTATVLARYEPRPNSVVSVFVDALRAPRGIPPFEGSGYVRYWRFSPYDSLLVGVSGQYGPPPEQVPQTWGFREVRAQVYTHLHRDEIRDYQDATYQHLTTNPLAWFVASAYANQTYGAAVQSSWALNRGNRLDTSARYQIDRNGQQELSVPRGTVPSTWGPWDHYGSHQFSMAVEDRQRLGDWRVLAGFGGGGQAVLDEQHRDKSYPVTQRILPAFEGRVAVDWEPIDGLRPMLAMGHKVRLPMLNELFSNHLGGNPDLHSERAWMIETGVDTTNLGAPGLSTTTRLFANDIVDLIVKYRDAYANVGQAITAGAEVELRYAPPPVPFLQLVGGYRYLYSRDLDAGHVLDYRTPHRVLLGARVSSQTGFSASVDATFQSGQRAWYADGLTGVWAEDRLPGYALLNVHARYDGPAWRYGQPYVFVDVFNATDALYAMGSFEPRPGREITVGIGGRL